MGCGSSSPEAAETKEMERLVKKKLMDAKEKDASKVKLLILGAGESGKSTLFKQMKLLYGAPFTPEEAEYMRNVIRENVMETMQELVSNVGNFLETDCADSRAKELLLDAAPDDEICGELGEAVVELWADKAVQEMWEMRARLQIIESVKYFLDKLPEVVSDEYVPSTQDILYARVRTHGIVTERYLIEGKPYEMYDVGGQRNERRKWVNCFDGVTAVLFVVAISEFDQKMFEDEATNRMVDALELFEEVCSNPSFDKASLILFLNKRDLFESKITKVNIKDQPMFEDYNGRPYSYDDGVAYFTRKFLALNQEPEREIYSHVTCATDTSNIRVVFNSCRDTILRQLVKDSGFM